MSKKVVKTLHYLRAITDGQPFNLEAASRSMLMEAATVHQSQVDEYGLLTQIQHRRPLPQTISGDPLQGLLLHIGSGTKDEHMRTMQNQAAVPNDDGGSQPPPIGHSFLSKEAFVYINNHHVLFCGHGLHASRVASYLAALSRQLHENNQNIPLLNVEFHAVADCNKLRMIQEHGVRYISLNASAHQLSIDQIYAETQSGLAQWLQGLTHTIQAEPTLDELNAQSEIQVGVWWELKGNTKAGLIAKEMIKQQAEQVVNDEDVSDGFYIETQNYEKIRPHEVKLSKPVRLPRYEQANTLSVDETFHALLDYFQELEQDNLTET